MTSLPGVQVGGWPAFGMLGEDDPEGDGGVMLGVGRGLPLPGITRLFVPLHVNIVQHQQTASNPRN